MGILKDRFLLGSIIISLGLRLILAHIPGFKIDMDAWFGWDERLNQVGPSGFYSDQVWTNYTPGYLYILWFLGLLKNLFKLSTDNFYLLLKIPSIIAEITLAILVYKILNKNNWAKISLLLILLNPAFIFNSAIWGQIDGLLSLMLVLSIYYLNQKHLVISSLFLAIGLLIKPQALLLIPVFVLYIVKNFSLKNIAQIVLPSLSTILLLSLPFFPSPFDLVNLINQMSHDYSYSSLFAYNLWGVVGFWLPDASFRIWGYILLVSYWAIMTYFYFKKKLSLYSLAVLASLSFFFLPTRVHERYLYPGLIFLILTTSLLRSPLLLILTTILSLMHFFNLYYVYVYYNEFYLKLPKMLYNPILYNFLTTNGKLMSSVSTALFILISTTIIKSQYAHKKS